MARVLRALLLCLALAILAGCDRVGLTKSADSGTASAAATQSAPQEVEIIVPVQVALPERGNIASHFETTARVEAERQVRVVAEGMGQCVAVNVEEGDRVHAGDVLAQLDTAEIMATIGQTEVQVRQQRTAYDIAEKSLAEGIGSKAERDNARFAYEQVLAALEMQKVQLDKLTIRAPLGGVVTERHVKLGQTVAAGAPVFTIVDPDSFMLTINPPERELARLKVGQLARVSIDAIAGQEFQATVRRINPNVDPASGTVKVTLDFDAATRAKLREAAFARVRLVMETHENVLLVPKDALIEENARRYLFVVEKPVEAETEEPAVVLVEPETVGGAVRPEMGEAAAQDFVANRVEVDVGLEDSSKIEVLSGVTDTSLVVVLGQHTLKPGAQVRVTNTTDEILAKAGMTAEEALKAAKESRENKDSRPALRPKP